MEIYLFGKVYQVELLYPILFIACDTPAANKLCGHYSSYNQGVKGVTCSCDVPFSELDNPNYFCSSVTWDVMNEIVMNGSDV